MASNNKSAFSLIELSVVILVIGLLVLGVTQGSRILRESKLKTAAALTSSSPVVSTAGLALWIDASDSSRIANTANIYGNPSDGTAIDNVKDRSSVQGNEEIIFNGGSSSAKPTYISAGINGLPVLRFDGVDDYLVSSANINSLRYTDGQENTMFMVIVPHQDSGSNYVFRHGSGSILYYYIHNLTPPHGHFLLGSSSHQGANFEYEKPMIITGYSMPGSAARTYNNGQNSTPSSATITLTHASTLTYIGASSSSSSFSDVDIAEIIIFNRALKLKEREDIEDYLGKKWGIKVL